MLNLIGFNLKAAKSINLITEKVALSNSQNTNEIIFDLIFEIKKSIVSF